MCASGNTLFAEETLKAEERIVDKYTLEWFDSEDNLYAKSEVEARNWVRGESILRYGFRQITTFPDAGGKGEYGVECLSDSALSPLSFRIWSSSSEAKGAVANGKATLFLKIDGVESKRTVDIKAGSVLDAQMFTAFIKRGVEEGSAGKIRVLNSDTLSVVETQMVVLKKIKRMANGRPVILYRLRVDYGDGVAFQEVVVDNFGGLWEGSGGPSGGKFRRVADNEKNLSSGKIKKRVDLSLDVGNVIVGPVRQIDATRILFQLLHPKLKKRVPQTSWQKWENKDSDVLSISRMMPEGKRFNVGDVLPKEILRYLSDTEMLNINNEVVAKFADRTIGLETDSIMAVQKIAEIIPSVLNKGPLLRSMSAQDIIDSEQGDEIGYAIASAAALRNKGFPCRLVYGIIYSSRDCFEIMPWLEVWSNGWMPADIYENAIPTDAARVTLASANFTHDDIARAVSRATSLVRGADIEVLEALVNGVPLNLMTPQRLDEVVLRTELATNLRNVKAIVRRYREYHGVLPPSLDAVVTHPKLSSEMHPASYYDTWGRLFNYSPGVDEKQFTISSVGKDATPNTADDITLAIAEDIGEELYVLSGRERIVRFVLLLRKYADEHDGAFPANIEELGKIHKIAPELLHNPSDTQTSDTTPSYEYFCPTDLERLAPFAEELITIVDRAKFHPLGQVVAYLDGTVQLNDVATVQNKLSVQRRAIDVMSKKWVDNQIPELLSYLKMPWAMVRYAAVSALDKWGGHSSVHRAFIALAKGDESEAIRMAALKALGRAPINSAIPDLQDCLADGSLVVRLETALALIKHNTKIGDKALWSVLCASDMKISDRIEAISVLGNTGEREAKWVLVDILADRDLPEAVRLSAHLALSNLLPSYPVATSSSAELDALASLWMEAIPPRTRHRLE